MNANWVKKHAIAKLYVWITTPTKMGSVCPNVWYQTAIYVHPLLTQPVWVVMLGSFWLTMAVVAKIPTGRKSWLSKKTKLMLLLQQLYQLKMPRPVTQEVYTVNQNKFLLTQFLNIPACTITQILRKNLQVQIRSHCFLK